MTSREQDALHAAVKAAVDEALSDERLERAVETKLPLALGTVLGPMIYGAVRADTRSYRRRVMVGFLILFAGLGYAIHDNRERGTQSRAVLCQIITGGDVALYAYEREGTISRPQLRRALRQSADYRRLLSPAPSCSPSLTPPPVRLPPTPHP